MCLDVISACRCNVLSHHRQQISSAFSICLLTGRPSLPNHCTGWQKSEADVLARQWTRWDRGTLGHDTSVQRLRTPAAGGCEQGGNAGGVGRQVCRATTPAAQDAEYGFPADQVEKAESMGRFRRRGRVDGGVGQTRMRTETCISANTVRQWTRESQQQVDSPYTLRHSRSGCERCQKSHLLSGVVVLPMSSSQSCAPP